MVVKKTNSCKEEPMTSNKLLYRLPKMKGFRVTWLKLVASFICQNSSCFYAI